MALGKFRVTSLRDSVIDYTYPFTFEPAAMVMRRPDSSGKKVQDSLSVVTELPPLLLASRWDFRFRTVVYEKNKHMFHVHKPNQASWIQNGECFIEALSHVLSVQDLYTRAAQISFPWEFSSKLTKTLKFISAFLLPSFLQWRALVRSSECNFHGRMYHEYLCGNAPQLQR